MVLHSTQTPAKSAQLQDLGPTLGWPRRTVLEGNPLSKKNAEQCIWLFFSPGLPATAATGVNCFMNNG